MTSSAQCSVCEEWKHPNENFTDIIGAPRVCLDCHTKIRWTARLEETSPYERLDTAEQEAMWLLWDKMITTPRGGLDSSHSMTALRAAALAMWELKKFLDGTNSSLLEKTGMDGLACLGVLIDFQVEQRRLETTPFPERDD